MKQVKLNDCGAVVARSVGLCRDATCTHADEGAVPIDEVKDRHADSQRTDC